MERVTEWQNRPLDSVYPIVYLDCIFLKIRQDKRVINKAIYLALCVNLEGHKELLGMWISENEGAKFWLSVLTDLQNKGVKDFLIACVDGLTGFPDAINTVYQDARVQLCIVHMVRNSLKFIPWKDYNAVTKDLKADKEKKKDSVITGSGELLSHVQVTTSRALESLFGKVNVTRIGYSQINNPSLFPVDAELNLATNRYSDGLYHRVSNEAIRGSFDNVVETVSTTTGANIPKKQSINIVKNVARDFEVFYQKKRFIKPEKMSDLLVLTFDKKLPQIGDSLVSRINYNFQVLISAY